MSMRNVGLRNGLTLVLGAALLALAVPAAAGRKTVDAKKSAVSDSLAAHGYKCLAADKAKAAVSFFAKAAKVDPGNASAFEGLGDTWSVLGKDDKARSAWSKADELTDGRSSRTQASRLDKDGGPKDFTIENSLLASGWSSRAYKAETKGDYKLAAELFNKALAADKNYWHARKGLDEIQAAGMDTGQAEPSLAGSGKDGASTDDDDDK
jgi:tetratricopeptide (TPR) repeat protein